MTEIAAMDSTLRGPARRAKASPRSYLPPLLAIASLALGHFLYGGATPLAALAISACLIGSAIIALIFAGPSSATFAMLVGAGLIWAYAASGAAGDLARAAPELAALFAAGAMFVVGHICARQRGALDIALRGLVWTSFVYCLWFFFRNIAGAVSGEATSDFASPTAASLLFGLFALIAAGRVLYVVKRMDAEALSRSAMVDRLFSDGLDGLLLLGFSLTCLTVAGSRAGLAFALSALLLQVWWDTRGITAREHRSAWVRWLARATPLIASLIAIAGVYLGFARNGGGVGLGWPPAQSLAHDFVLRIQHLDVYLNAFLDNPLTGHGLGSLAAVRDQAMTLGTAEALLAPGGAQNAALATLVEIGAVGAALLVAALLIIHIAILRGFRERKAPRTFMRLALCASLLLALHGFSDSSLDLPSAIWLYAFIAGAACGTAAAGARSSSSRAIPE